MILDLLAISGATIVVTKSYIFKPVREFMSKKSDYLGELFACPMCMSLWIGLAFLFIPSHMKTALHYPLIASLSTYIIYLIIERLKIR